MYDLLIVGGGPAAAAAGVYAARKKIKTILITEDFGGQSSVSLDVQNFIGIISVSGHELGKLFKDHLKAYADDTLEIVEGDRVAEIQQLQEESPSSGFSAKTRKGANYQTRAVLVASGSRRRKLAVPGAEEFDGKGVVYCASCDAPLFAGMDVAVIGGGNAGFESAQQLLSYATHITLLEQGDMFRADLVTQEKVLADKKVTALTGVKLKEIKGSAFVEGLVYTDKEGTEHELKVGGVFVEIGSIANTDYVKDLVELNKIGEVVVDHKTQRSSREGIWAAGDASDVLYKQNNISMGDGVKALEDIFLWIRKQN